MSSRLESDLNLFHSRNIFLSTKTILLTGEVGEEMFSEFIKNLHALDSVTGNITVKLMSEGGCLTTARAIYDAIVGAKNHITGVAYGEVASSGSIIFQAFDERIMTPSSRLLLHVGEEGIPTNHPKNVEAMFNNHRIDETWIENVYLEKIKQKKKRYTRQQMKDLIIFDRFIYTKEAIELGLCDSVGDNQ